MLLNLKDQDYPGTKKFEGLADLGPADSSWAKDQGRSWDSRIPVGVSQVSRHGLPKLEMPGFDGIGANEYIVDVTHPNSVDFISAVDTPYVWELNIWYHTLNFGFRTRIAGETDFPCIYDSRVGWEGPMLRYRVP